MRLRAPPPARAAALRGLRLRRGRGDRRRDADRDARLRRHRAARARRQHERPSRTATRSCACCSATTTSRRATAAASCRRSTASPAGARAAAGPTGSTTSTASRRPSAPPSGALSGGERVWWDHHDWEAAQRVPAVVGSFPEPFRSGTDGKRFPVRLVCLGDDERSCDEVADAARGRRHQAASRARRSSSPAASEVLRVIVGPLGRRPARPGGALARARAGVERHLREADAAPATGSSCSTATGGAVRTLRRAAAGWWRRRASRRRRRPGSSPGPTRSASAAAAAALTEERLEQPLRARGRRRARTYRCRWPGRGRAVIATHRRRASPLHAARAGIGALWCFTLALVALSFEHPVVLAALLVALLAAAGAARVGREVGRALAWALPLALAIALINAIVTRDGLTVSCPRARAAGHRPARRDRRGGRLRRRARAARRGDHRLRGAARRGRRSRRAAARRPPAVAARRASPPRWRRTWSACWRATGGGSPTPSAR